MGLDDGSATTLGLMQQARPQPGNDLAEHQNQPIMEMDKEAEPDEAL
jgi:hypothetical protein